MKVLIAGIPEHTKNYENALALCHVPFGTDLYPPSLSSYGKLLLPGGGDLHPSWFGQTDRGSVSVDRALDRAQLALLHTFLLAGKPVLGICRGMQLLNVYFGGDLIQDLETADRHRFRKTDQIHSVSCLPDSLLHGFYGASCLVNSAHHQGCGRIGTDLAVTQTAPDQTVEALEHRTRPVLGVHGIPSGSAFSRNRPVWPTVSGSSVISQRGYDRPDDVPDLQIRLIHHQMRIFLIQRRPDLHQILQRLPWL